MAFNHEEIERKWQARWEESKCFEAHIIPDKKKFYALDMFPYPSGAGLHVGHLASYTPTDIVSRYKRAQGFNVLHPIGYDAFGLPAEQYAIQTGVHPEETTKKAIQNFKRQLKSFGYSFDWSREICTCDPSYYKWTQKIFLLLFKKNLAYKKKAPVNWCPALRTTLANEEVVDGKSERGGHPVIQQHIKQWILKITEYAERLLTDLKNIDWPQRTKDGQTHWIGKSQGLCMDFPVHREKISIFTTRPDTIFGCTFLVLSPEHPLIEKEFSKNKEFKQIKDYQEKCRKMNDLEKQKNLDITGIFSGSYSLHPLTQKKIPIWISNYVLMEYGTGAIMAVPAHDERDFVFAQKFKIPCRQVIQSLNSNTPLPYIEKDGVCIHSKFLDKLSVPEAQKKIIQYMEEKKMGYKKTQYKLRDWIFSRQRYWGEPFPIVYINSKAQAVPDQELPVTLPPTAHYEPSEKGEPPLARIQSFVQYKNNKNQTGERETDTMPGSAASSWYFLRYTDPHNEKEPFGFEAQKYWMPVDLYVGGVEHVVGHLLYSRFWQKILYDMGLVSHAEPFKKLVHQGSILGEDGFRMSKSRGNTVNPDDICQEYGADATRLYISFLGPFDKDKPWSSKGIEGCRRFLERIWRLCFDENKKIITNDTPPSEKLNRCFHQTIQKVTEDLEKMSFNTAISAMMILVNEMYSEKSHNRNILKTLAQLLQPFAPHISEEIWESFNEKGLVFQSSWPQFESQYIQKDTVTLAVQINGKLKTTLEVSPSETEEEVLMKAKEIEKISQALKNRIIKKVIYRPGRILNIVSTPMA